jgi:hypothetical protein
MGSERLATVRMVDLESFFMPLRFEEPIVLYDGLARLHVGDSHVDGVGQLRFEWRRTPGVRWGFASDQIPTAVLSDDDGGAKHFEPLAISSDLQPPSAAAVWTKDRVHDVRYRDHGRQAVDAMVGRSDGFTVLQALVLNYVSQIREDRPTMHAHRQHRAGYCPRSIGCSHPPHTALR